MADLVDPFDNPGVRVPAAPQPAAPTDLVDPFDDPAFNRPTGEVRASQGLPGPVGQPITLDSPEAGASFWTTLKASLHPDIQKQIETFAADRGIDIRRYGVDRDGNIVFLNDEGRVVREIPSVTGASGVYDFMRRLGQFMGFHTGENIPQAAAAGVGVAMGPTPLSIPAAGATATAVDAGRQALANMITGHEGIDWMNALGHGALATVGQGVTTGINRAVTRNPLKVGGQDLQVLRSPTALREFERNAELARRQGITVTPAENTGARSLLNRQRQLGRFDESATILDDFFTRRNTEEIPAAFNAMAARISPQGNAALGARRMGEGAQQTIDFFNRVRSAAASPHYEAAFASGVEPDISHVLDLVKSSTARTANKSEGRKALQRVQGFLQDERKVVNPETGETVTEIVPEANYGKLHNAKLNIDKMIDDIEDGKLSVERDTLRSLVGIQKELTAVLRNAHPEYEKGYQAFIAASAPLDEATGGIVGLAARDRSTNFSLIPRNMLGSTSDPVAIRSARKQFEQANQMDAWNEGVRSYLTTAFEQSQKRMDVGKDFFKTMYRDPRQRRNLRAAMAPEQFQAFEDLMKTLEMVARAPAEGSQTATDLGARRSFAGPAARGASSVLKGVSLDLFPRLGQWIEDFSAGRNAGAIAEIITRPDAIQELKKLRTLRPGSQKALTVIDQALATAGLYATGARTPEERPIGSFGP